MKFFDCGELSGDCKTLGSVPLVSHFSDSLLTFASSPAPVTSPVTHLSRTHKLFPAPDTGRRDS